MHKLLKPIWPMLLSLALVAVFAPGVALAAETGSEVEVFAGAVDPAKVTVDEALPEQDELLDMYMEKQAKGAAAKAVESSSSKKWAARKTKLSGRDLIAYTELAKAIGEIAAGQRDSAVVWIPANKLLDQTVYTAKELGYEEINSEAKAEFIKRISFDYDRVLVSLLMDLPYEFYWYDKVNGIDINWVGVQGTSDIIGFFRDDAGLEIAFDVSKDYQPLDAASSTDVDTGKTGATTAAADTAGSIVEEYADLSDVEKITAYKDKICDLVDYNTAAADNDDTPYGDPWQLIWVFDNDPETKVVCEGYAKAYQFLCDLSTFKSTLTESFLISGTLDGAGHMWNIMRMPDNKRYLVDVTNSEPGAIGMDDRLFLKGCLTGDVDNGYTFSSYSLMLEYKYKDITRFIYEDKELTLSNTDYDPSVVHEHSMEFHQGKPAKCTEEGIIDTWTCPDCEQMFSDPDGTTLVRDDELAIEPLGHEYGAWTRLNDSMHQRVCSHDSTHVEKENHNWNDGVVTKEATANLPGEKLFTCSVCGAERTEIIPAIYGEDLDEITPTDGTADQAEVDAAIPVIDAKKIVASEDIGAGSIGLKFPVSDGVNNYRVQYRLAGETDWTSAWSEGTDSFVIQGLGKSSLCEFRIAGFVKQEDLSWKCGEWSDVSYRYMSTVSAKSIKTVKTKKVVKKTLTLTWAKDKKCSGYQVQYSLKKNMAGAKTVTVKGASKNKCTIKKLRSGKKYYVKVRPIKTKSGQTYVGVLSGVKAFKAK